MTVQVPPVAHDRTSANATSCRPLLSRDTTHAKTNGVELVWPEAYLHATPQQRQEWLRRAGQQQGLLDDVPVFKSTGVKAQVNLLLHDILNGSIDQLQGVPPYLAEANAGFNDAALSHDAQRIIAAAVNTPDLYLIMALPGSDRTRVMSAIIMEAISRGQRVLLVAADASHLDQVLSLVSQQEHVQALRHLAIGEQLPEEIQALTLETHCNNLLVIIQGQRQERLVALTTALHDAEQRLQLWKGWRDRVATWQAHHADLENLVTEHQGIPEQVQKEHTSRVASGMESGRYLVAYAAEDKRHEAKQEELAEAFQVTEAVVQERRQEWEKWQIQVQAQEQVVEQRKARNWLSLSWWKAALHGRSDERLNEFRLRVTEAEQELHKAQQRSQEIRQQIDIENQRHQAACEQILHGEIEQRRHELERRIQELREEQNAFLRAWNEDGTASGGSDVWAQQPTPLVVIEKIRRCEQEVQCAQSALEQAQAMAKLPLPERVGLGHALHRYCNLIAMPQAALREGLNHLQEPLDVLVCLQAEQFSRADFSGITEWAHRWVWCGVPVSFREELDPDAQPFAVVAQRLLGSRHLRSCVWQQEGETIRCELHRIPPGRDVQSEPLVDHPEVSLQIHTPTVGPPVLQAVTFPKECFSLAAAKQLLAADLGERPLSPCGPWVTWLLKDGDLTASFDHGPKEDCQVITWEDGIIETAALCPSENGSCAWHTCQLQFPTAHGWTWQKATTWLEEQLQLSDTGRVGILRDGASLSPMQLKLFNGLLGAHGLPPLRSNRTVMCAEDGCHVLWLPQRLCEEQDHGTESVFGSGSQPVDLADARQRMRLPHKLQAELPHRGIIDYAQASCLLRYVEHQFRNGPTQIAPEPHVVILALHGAQLNLLQTLWRHREWWGRQPPKVRFSLVQRSRDQQAAMVVVSLFRPGGHVPCNFSEWLQIMASARQRLVLVGDLPIHATTMTDGDAFSSFLATLHTCEAESGCLPAVDGVPA